MILEVILISFIIAVIRKGKIRNILNYEIKFKVLFLLYILIQIGLVFFGNKLPDSALKYSMFIYLFSYLLLMGFLLQNVDKPEFIIILMGVFLNFAVTFINGGKMPLSLDAAALTGLKDSGNIFLERMIAISNAMDSETKLKILGDIIPMPSFYPLSVVISPGDVIIFVGLFMTVQKMFVQKNSQMYLTPKKEVEREENYFNSDVKLVDINEFFNPNNENDDKYDDNEYNAIARLVEEISETKEPEANEFEFHTKQSNRPQMQDNKADGNESEIDKEESEQPVLEIEEEKVIEIDQLMLKDEDDCQALIIEEMTEQDILKVEQSIHKQENEESAAQKQNVPQEEATEAHAQSAENAESEVEKGQLTFLDPEMAMYVDLFKTNSPLKEYIRSVADQPAENKNTQDNANNVKKQVPLQDIGQELKKQQEQEKSTKLKTQPPLQEETIIQTKGSDHFGERLSDTTQLSIKDLAKPVLIEDDLEHPTKTRQLNARPSTKAILRALRGGDSFEYNKDKYTITVKDDDAPISTGERKEMFLKRLYEYDIDIRKTQAATTEEKEQIEMEIKRDQGINVDDMFIIQNGKFIENPNYKHKKKKK
jgi:hypothetical protein